MSELPDEIFVGYFGGHKIWGAVTCETHPQNVRYTKNEVTHSERAEMRAAIRELRKGLTRLRKTIEVNADDVFWMHDMGACHESAHDCIDNLLENTKKWS